jgi:hypothetical protein
MADQGGGGPAGSGGHSGVGPGGGFSGPSGAGIGPGETSSSGDLGFDGGANERGPDNMPGKERGFFDSIMNEITNNPVPTGLSVLGMLTGVPAFGIMGLASRLGKAFGDPNSVGSVGPGPGDGDGPDRPQVQQIVPTFNPIEDMVGSEYVAYGGVGADQLRKQLFPYMNFNQPTQPGVTGLMGQYTGAGQGTGLMTGPFGMSNTQV